MAYIKGQNVKATYGNGNTSFFQKETSCSFSLQANTVDASNKSDANPDYDSPEFDDYEGSMSAEGQISDYTEIRSLLTQMQNGEVTNVKLSGTNITVTAQQGYITSLDIDMPADGLVTGSISADLAGTINVTQ